MKKLFYPFLFLGLLLVNDVQSQPDTIIYRPGPYDGMDAETRDDLPDQNRGDLYDFICNAWTAQGNFFIMRSFIRFDFSGIPQNAHVVSAVLDLYTNVNTGHYQMDSGPNQSYLLRLTQDWDEHQITWNNQPSSTFLNAVNVPPSTSNTQTYHLDLTSHVQEMVTNPETNFGWVLRLETEETYRCLAFSSSDHWNAALRPRLTVVYGNCLGPKADFSYSRDENSVSFTDLSSLASSWEWQFGDGTYSSLQNPQHTYNAPGLYEVTLKITDSCGVGYHTDMVEIPCQPPQSGFYFDYNMPSVEFHDTTHSASILSWNWNFGDGSSSTLQNPSHLYTEQGVYHVCLTVTDSCSTDTVCKEVPYVLPLMVHFTSGQSTVNGLEVSFSDQTHGASKWHWDFGDGTSSELKNTTHLYADYGYYTVCLTVSNQLEQVDKCDSLQLRSLAYKNIRGLAALSPNPPQQNNAKLYFSNAHAFAYVTLFNLTGKTMERWTFASVTNTQAIDLVLPDLPSGLYLIKVEADGEAKVIKMMIN